MFTDLVFHFQPVSLLEGGLNVTSLQIFLSRDALMIFISLCEIDINRPVLQDNAC